MCEISAMYSLSAASMISSWKRVSWVMIAAVSPLMLASAEACSSCSSSAEFGASSDCRISRIAAMGVFIWCAQSV